MTTTLTSAWADNLRFLRALVTNPKSVGAIFPSSPALAQAIARQIDPAAGPVLEIGPGTGVVSEAILERGVAPQNLTLLEYDEAFAQHLATRFPQVHVVQGDAFDLDRTLGARLPFGAIVSCLPLLNFPSAQRLALMDGLAARLLPGAPLIQFSYGLHAPVVPPDGFAVTCTAYVLANLPPAKVWVYRQN
ncbi:MAG: methyltransferase domain-containing protein [Alphaproteobacteria bacterium]|nr:methyltransferase domain-containing protein [Alphaproteobacteria bacterium]